MAKQKRKNKDGADAHAKAHQVLGRLQKALLKRLADYVIENESGLRQAAEGAEGYGFSLHQLDEIFLSRLNLIERAMAELQKSTAGGANRYRSMVFSASRDGVEHEINSRLEKVPSARILGVAVSPMSKAAAPSHQTHQFTEIEESVAEAVRSAAAGENRAVDAPGADEPGDVIVDLPEARTDDVRPDEDRGGGDELLVTVLYYGPALAADA